MNPYIKLVEDLQMRRVEEQLIGLTFLSKGDAEKWESMLRQNLPQSAEIVLEQYSHHPGRQRILWMIKRFYTEDRSVPPDKLQSMMEVVPENYPVSREFHYTQVSQWPWYLPRP